MSHLQDVTLSNLPSNNFIGLSTGNFQSNAVTGT